MNLFVCEMLIIAGGFSEKCGTNYFGHLQHIMRAIYSRRGQRHAMLLAAAYD